MVAPNLSPSEPHRSKYERLLSLESKARLLQRYLRQRDIGLPSAGLVFG
jgi:hypothetical protein